MKQCHNKVTALPLTPAENVFEVFIQKKKNLRENEGHTGINA